MSAIVFDDPKALYQEKRELDSKRIREGTAYLERLIEFLQPHFEGKLEISRHDHYDECCGDNHDFGIVESIVEGKILWFTFRKEADIVRFCWSTAQYSEQPSNMISRKAKLLLEESTLSAGVEIFRVTNKFKVTD